MGDAPQGAQRGSRHRPISRGVLIHAYNNEEVDYTLIALCNALAIKTHLHVPVCLVTNHGSLNWLRQNHDGLVDHAFDHIIQQEAGQVGDRRFNDTATHHMLPWSNQSRSDSYALSPFYETLLIDADY